MRSLSYVFAILAACLAAGCSTIGQSIESSVIDLMSVEGEPIGTPKELSEIAPNKITISELWQTSANEGQGRTFLELEMAMEGGLIYAVDYTGDIMAINQQTGEKVWEVTTNLPISGGLGIGAENLFVGTTDGEVIAIRLIDGETSWTSEVTSEVLSIPRYSEGKVVIRSIDGAIASLNADDGEKQWTYVKDVPALSLRGTSSPVIKSGGVIAGYANGQLVVIRLNDGMQIWQTSVAVPRGRGALSRMVDVDSDPLAGDRFIYAATYNGGLAAVDIRNGQIAWRSSELSSYKQMSADWTSVFLVDTNNVLWSADQTSGDINWSQASLEHRGLTAPVTMGDYLLLGDFEGYLHVISIFDGELVGRMKVSDKAIKMPPIVEGDNVFVQDVEGTITALTLSSDSGDNE